MYQYCMAGGRARCNTVVHECMYAGTPHLHLCSGQVWRIFLVQHLAEELGQRCDEGRAIGAG